MTAGRVAELTQGARETTIQTQDQFRTAAVRSHGPPSPEFWTLRHKQQAADEAEENHIQRLEKSALVPSRVVSSPHLLFSLHTNNRTAKDLSVKIIRCADDMTDESLYKCGVEQLSLWCNQNNLELNMLRNVETSVGAVQHHPPPRLKVPVNPPIVTSSQTIPFILTVEALQYSPQQ